MAQISSPLGQERQLGDGIPRPARRHVERRRVQLALEQAVGGAAVTQVVSAAGTGKTAAVAAWARRTDRAVEWFGADRHGELAETLRRGADSHALDDRVVVVDDAHLLAAPQLERLLEVVGDGSRCRAVLAARRDVPVPVALAVSSDFAELRARDLSFDHEEARALARLHAPSLDADQVDELRRITGGWAAALLLAARMVEHADQAVDATWALRSTSQPVLDFLVGESLQCFPEETRAVLHATCGAADVDVESLAALTGDPAAPAHLDALARDGLLVTAHHDGRRPGGTVWSFHPLLTEMVMRRSRQSQTGVDEAKRARQRAVRFYRDHNRPDLALRHAVAAADPQLVRELLGVHGAGLVAAGDVAVVVEALEALAPLAPEDAIGLALQGLVHREEGRVELAVADSARLSTGWPSVDPADQDVHVGVRAIRTRLELWRAALGWAPLAEAVRAARRELGCDHTSSGSPHRLAHLEVGQAGWLMADLAGAEIRAGDLITAETHVQEALLIAGTTNQDALEAEALGLRSVLELAAGTPASAAVTARHCLELAGTRRTCSSARARAHLVLAWAACLRIDAEDAAAALAAHRCERGREDPVLRALAKTLEVFLLLIDGRPTRAQRVIDSCGDREGDLPPFVLRGQAFARAGTSASTGSFDGLDGVAGDLERLGFPGDAQVVRAIGAAAGGRPQDALEVLDTMSGRHTVHGDTPSIGLALRAGVLLALGDRAQATIALRQALAAVEAQQMPLVLGAGVTAPGFRDLLASEALRPDGHPYAPTARDATSRLVVVHGGGPAVVQPVGPAVVLTSRQAQVLEQLSLGGSYEDIARDLYITENTVKTHVIALYRRLGVQRRPDALRRARQLGLL